MLLTLVESTYMYPLHNCLSPSVYTTSIHEQTSLYRKTFFFFSYSEQYHSLALKYNNIRVRQHFWTKTENSQLDNRCNKHKTNGKLIDVLIHLT